jgi:hypothetical protein
MNNLFKYIGASFLVFVFASCEKSFDEKTELNNDFSNKSIVQVFLATVGASRNYIYVDGKQVTGALISSGGLFPATGIGFQLQPGLRQFLVRDTLSTSTQLPLGFGEEFAAGKRYSLFLYDTINAMKYKILPLQEITPVDSTIRIRFANFAYNGTAATPSVDLFSVVRNEVIASNVGYTAVTDFVPYPSEVSGEGFQVRLAGTTTVLATISNISFTRQRSYTVAYRGSHRATSGTSARAISVFANN